MTTNKYVKNWINEMAQLTTPDSIVWINGTEEQRQELLKEACATGELTKLNEEKFHNCYYHRSASNDVSRVEHLTFICTKTQEEVGPSNNWMRPDLMYEKLKAISKGAMKGRTMYVIPYSMGIVGSPFSRIGIELTDSIYVVLNMLIMTRVGAMVMESLSERDDFVKGLHCKCDLDISNRYIVHFPQDNLIWSVNSGYGGNALLGKKCFALRIASWLGKKEGWLAEHMLILGIEFPDGKTQYIAAAFPSACGKTNLAMLVPPEIYKQKNGIKVWCVGDDIAWLRIGDDGRLWAMNPENGFFGVVPGTNLKSNPNMLKTTERDTIFTNVVLNPEDNTVWWEGLDNPPSNALDWKGNKWSPESNEKGAHPNSRFTSPAKNCPAISKEFDNPLGVPLSAIVFGGRRAKTSPLVYEAADWVSGVFTGSIMGSETTAAASGNVGVLRRDPMAMYPFCGYHMGDYFNHWLEMGKRLTSPPKIFNVNWFRTDENGKFIWPGFSENLRVLMWILDRCNHRVDARETPLGFIPYAEDINLEQLEISKKAVEQLLDIDPAMWRQEVESIGGFYDMLGDKVPKELRDRLENLRQAFNILKAI